MSTESTETFAPEDIEKNKTMAGLAYLLFFLPLIVCPDSPYGKYHANQGLVLLIFGVGASIALAILSFILGFIPVIGWIILLIFPLFYFLLSVLVLVLAVMGLMNGLNGNAKELPVIGKFKILK